MLPLAAKEFPATPDALTAAVIAGFSARAVSARSVTAEGTALDALDSLRIDLTGAQVTRSFRVSTAGATGPVTVNAARFEVTAEPLDLEGAPVQVRLEAEGAELRFGGEPEDGALALANAASGSVSFSVAQAALESLLNRLATAAGAKQGVEIKKTKLDLTAHGPRALSFRCDATVKIFVMSADLSLSGDLEVDDGFNARFSKLVLGGDAMVTKLAGGLVRPHLDKLEGRVIPLFALSPGELPLREVEIGTRDGLEVRAKFGRG